jgi:hypothetical protein
LDWKLYNASLTPIENFCSDGESVVTTWETENLPPFLPEASMPPGDSEIARLDFSPIGLSTWRDAASWFHKLFSGRFEPSRNIRERALSLKESRSNAREKLEALFSFVRDQIRYIAIETGINGYQPEPASSVYLNRYGDCKDMVGLLSAMASCVDIPVHPVLISTWQNGQADTTLVSHAHFNHMIAVAELPGNYWFWMDPTDKTCSFGELPWYDQGRSGLIVGRDDGHGALTVTPLSTPVDNRVTRNWYLEADQNGAVSGILKVLVYGAQASKIRDEMRALLPPERDLALSRLFLSQFPLDQIEGELVSDIQNPDMPFFFQAKVFSERLIHQYLDRISFQPGLLNNFDLNRLFSASDRKYPLLLMYPMRIEDRMVFTLPENWNPELNVSGDTLKTAFGKLAWDWRNKDGKTVYRRTVDMAATRVSPEEYAEFRTFLNRIARHDQIKFNFSRRDSSMLFMNGGKR